MDLYIIGCPFTWFNQKCLLIWIICFYFSLVLAISSSEMRIRHVRRPIHEKGALARGHFQLAHLLHSRLGGHRV